MNIFILVSNVVRCCYYSCLMWSGAATTDYSMYTVLCTGVCSGLTSYRKIITINYYYFPNFFQLSVYFLLEALFDLEYELSLPIVLVCSSQQHPLSNHLERLKYFVISGSLKVGSKTFAQESFIKTKQQCFYKEISRDK